MTEETVKLQKFISDCGLMSRRAAEASICCGEFTVNGQPASLGDRVCPTRDVVRYRGKRVRGAGRKWYIMLNKPRGYVTTMSDERGAEKRGRAGRRPARRASIRSGGWIWTARGCC